MGLFHESFEFGLFTWAPNYHNEVVLSLGANLQRYLQSSNNFPHINAWTVKFSGHLQLSAYKVWKVITFHSLYAKVGKDNCVML